MDNLTINLLKYRGNDSTSFTGRKEGKMARTDLKLAEKDADGNKYEVIIPKDTTSINSSFVIEEEDAEWKAILERNLAECRRRANNELNHSTGIDF